MSKQLQRTKHVYKRALLFCAGLLLLLMSMQVQAQQHDSLILKNKDVIVGEIKQLDKGVLVLETDYSDSDFTIEWLQVKELYTVTRFLIGLKNGQRINGKVNYHNDSSRLMILSDDDVQLLVLLEDVVFLRQIKTNFWGRMKFNLDLGLTITKANNLKQFSFRTAAGYAAERWQIDVNYDLLRSAQDNVTATKRSDGRLRYQYYFKHDWFISAAITSLSNTQQAIQLRATAKLGPGRMIWHTNKKYWGVGVGLASNNEKFTLPQTLSRKSWEAFIASELNLFDVGDINILSTCYVFKGLTQPERWRTDVKLDVKVDLPLDFYIKPGITLNYDNRPAIVNRELDYVFMFGVGWEL